MKKRLLSAAAFAAIASNPAHATLINDSFNFALATTEITQTGTLDKFDSNLGVLNSVTLTLNGSAFTTISLTNFAATSVSGLATALVDLHWSSSLAGLDLSLIDLSMTFATPGGNLNYTPGQARSFGPLNDSQSTVLNPAAALFGAAGGGTFDITCNSLSGISILGGDGNLGSNQQTQAQCGAAIAYNFTPRTVTVPEPTTLALLGLGLLGGALRYRRS